VLALDGEDRHGPAGAGDVCGFRREAVAVVSEKVSVRILPCGLHRGVNGSFVLATRDDRREVVYAETAARGITTGEPADVTTLTKRFGSIRLRTLPVDQSLELITRTANERWC
jgi:hypothetical protein